MDRVNKVGEKCILYDHTYMWSLKKIELIDSETDWWLPEMGIRVGRGIVEGGQKGINFQL